MPHEKLSCFFPRCNLSLQPVLLLSWEGRRDMDRDREWSHRIKCISLEISRDTGLNAVLFPSPVDPMGPTCSSPKTCSNSSCSLSAQTNCLYFLSKLLSPLHTDHFSHKLAGGVSPQRLHYSQPSSPCRLTTSKIVFIPAPVS